MNWWNYKDNRVNLNFNKELSDEPRWCQVHKHEEVVFLDLSFLIWQNGDLIDMVLIASHSTEIWDLLLFDGLGLTYHVSNENDVKFNSHKSERRRRKETLSIRNARTHLYLNSATERFLAHTEGKERTPFCGERFPHRTQTNRGHRTTFL